jgi:hypothetical protein
MKYYFQCTFYIVLCVLIYDTFVQHYWSLLLNINRYRLVDNNIDIYDKIN